MSLQVAWIKSDSKAILAIHTLMVALNPRLSVRQADYQRETIETDFPFILLVIY